LERKRETGKRPGDNVMQGLASATEDAFTLSACQDTLSHTELELYIHEIADNVSALSPSGVSRLQSFLIIANPTCNAKYNVKYASSLLQPSVEKRRDIKPTSGVHYKKAQSEKDDTKLAQIHAYWKLHSSLGLLRAHTAVISFGLLTNSKS